MINNIKNKITILNDKVASLYGKVEILSDNLNKETVKLSTLKKEQKLNSESVELLNLVQKATKEKIKDMFEGIVIKALQFIHQDEAYAFELEFGKRGNIPELNFNVKTPDLQESHDILNTRGGGTADIVSLALRLVLLEISKVEGFMFGDEMFKHLDSPETFEKAMEFIKEVQKNTGRQMFFITHKEEVVNSVDNPIII